MKGFEFATAGRIIFGSGTVQKVGALAAELGRAVLVVNGTTPDLVAPLLETLTAASLVYQLYPVSGEPTVASIQAGIQQARDMGCDVVIGFGGGSAVDTGKAVAVLLANPGEITDYLEVVGRGKALTQPSIPYIAIPTTAGTGSEVTRNAVLGVPEQQVKVSLRGPQMLPRLAVIDPQLTVSLPPAVTASTGLDALTQVIEPFVSNQANPLTDAFCREGLWRAARSLRQAYLNGQDVAAREDMCVVSLCGGLALANAKLGAVHGFAAPLGGMFPAPHGAVCARLLPVVMEVNVRALQERQPGSAALQRYVEVAQVLTGDPQATAGQGAAWVQELCTALQVPGLSAYGLARQDFPELVDKSAKASSMQGNPIKLTPEEMVEILGRAL